MEVWKDIEGYDNYQASSMGDIRRKMGKTIYKDGRIAEFSETVLKPSKDRKGYLRVFLSEKAKKKTIRVHKLIAIAFLNHVPCGMNLVVDHIDENKLNNKVDNLQILTNRENVCKSRSILIIPQVERKALVKTSKYVGVSWDKSRNKWSAEIRLGKTRKRLGRFVNEIDAYNAYKNALNEL